MVLEHSGAPLRLTAEKSRFNKMDGTDLSQADSQSIDLGPGAS